MFRHQKNILFSPIFVQFIFQTLIFTELIARPPNCPFSDFECLEVTVKNDLRKLQCNKEGKYKRSGGGNISPSWINEDKNQAIWWISNLNAWGIGDLYSLGTDVRGITGRNDEIDIDDEIDFGKPSDSKYSWYYWKRELESFEKVPDTDDFKIECMDMSQCQPDKVSFLFKLSYSCGPLLTVTRTKTALYEFL